LSKKKNIGVFIWKLNIVWKWRLCKLLCLKGVLATLNHYTLLPPEDSRVEGWMDWTVDVLWPQWLHAFSDYCQSKSLLWFLFMCSSIFSNLTHNSDFYYIHN